EARQRQWRRRRGLAALAGVAAASAAVAVFLSTGGGSGSGRGPTVGHDSGSSSPGLTKVAQAPPRVAGAMTVDSVPDWGPGPKVQATIADTGLLVNRGRKPVYVAGRPLILTVRTVGRSSVFRLQAAPDLRLAG